MPFSAIFNFQPAHIWCCSEFRRCRLQNLESQDHFSPHRAFKKSKTQTRGLQNHDFIKVVQIDGYWHSEFLVFIKCVGIWPALSYVEFASKEWHFKCLPTYFIPSTLFTWSWSNFHISIKMCCVSSMQKMLQKSSTRKRRIRRTRNNPIGSSLWIHRCPATGRNNPILSSQYNFWCPWKTLHT